MKDKSQLIAALGDCLIRDVELLRLSKIVNSVTNIDMSGHAYEVRKNWFAVLSYAASGTIDHSKRIETIYKDEVERLDMVCLENVQQTAWDSARVMIELIEDLGDGEK